MPEEGGGTWVERRGAGKGGGTGEKRESLEKEGSPWVGGEPRREKERAGQSRCTGEERVWEGGPREGRGLGGRREGPVGTEGHAGDEGVPGERRVSQKRTRVSGREKGRRVEGPSPQGEEGGFQ